MLPDTVRLNQQSKDQLIRLKRSTGVRNWNVLCRWALCLSLADPSPFRGEAPPSDSNVEMSWKTFAGQYGIAFKCLLAADARHRDLPEASVLAHHLARGISALTTAERPAIKDLILPAT